VWHRLTHSHHRSCNIRCVNLLGHLFSVFGLHEGANEWLCPPKQDDLKLQANKFDLISVARRLYGRPKCNKIASCRVSAMYPAARLWRYLNFYSRLLRMPMPGTGGGYWCCRRLKTDISRWQIRIKFCWHRLTFVVCWKISQAHAAEFTFADITIDISQSINQSVFKVALLNKPLQGPYKHQQYEQYQSQWYIFLRQRSPLP